MGLTNSSTSTATLKNNFNISRKENDIVVALAGNPNTGKSSIFNYITGLKQHTGNWPGKTVTSARGNYTYHGNNYILVDLPGTYSLFPLSQEEIIARDFICFGKPDATVVITDATSLERNLNLFLQVMELTSRVVLCVNLIDEAHKKGLLIDSKILEDELNIPVVVTSAKTGEGIDDLLKAIEIVSDPRYEPRPKIIKYSDKIETLIDILVEKLESKNKFTKFETHSKNTLKPSFLKSEEQLSNSNIELKNELSSSEIKLKNELSSSEIKSKNELYSSKIKLKNELYSSKINLKNERSDCKNKIDKNNLEMSINSRWLSLRIIEDDQTVFDSIEKYFPNENIDFLNEIRSVFKKENTNYNCSLQKSDINNNYDLQNKNIDYKHDFLNENIDYNHDLQNKNIVSDFNNEDKISKSPYFTNIRDHITKVNYDYSKSLVEKLYINIKEDSYDRDEKIDKLLTSKKFGFPIMIFLLMLVLWLTIQGSNYPSQFLSNVLFKIEPYLENFFKYLKLPQWMISMLCSGMYRSLAWIVSVMLPPMAIFFPLFTLLEDLGYLPRVAFNLDHLFKKACAHGKQCLTMCMGFGCNAAGVIGCRIIDSPRERLIAILTNNFVPCNGRFPLLITVSTLFFSSVVTNKLGSGIITALCVTFMIILGVTTTLFVSYLLSKTLLKGIPSTFTLELPPYRTPKISRIIYTSIIDRTIFVLSRAVMVAIPAGLITWILANTYIGDLSILATIAQFLDPFAKLIGLDGYILIAFILGFPANEIVLPIILMSYLATGAMVDVESLSELGKILLENNWTYLTALNVMLFSLLHWPCATTLLTIKKETGSAKWTIVGFLLPTVIAIIVCFITSQIYNFIF
ncbi:MAG: 50S ribosome-binding GTPase [Clostridioides sp.]|jgi:Fe2+ transport system protein B|nr:50S ribosome-binding GTPase [Clostridioides sp.]